MEQSAYRDQRKLTTTWSMLKQRIIYLPGAVIILYGFWLSLTI